MTHTKVALVLAFASLGAVASPGAWQAPAGDAFVLLTSVDAIAARPVWPGFRLSDWPIAVFDGKRSPRASPRLTCRGSNFAPRPPSRTCPDGARACARNSWVAEELAS